MKRAPFVIGATGLGLGLLFSFHTKPVHVNIVSSGPTTPPDSTSTTTPSSTATTGGTGTGSTPASTSPSTAATTRSATSQDIQYQYGDIQLKVTEKGSRVTNVSIVAESATDPRSAEINSQAIPILQQETISAGSANINGVSGATFTSEAYYQALQAALGQLK